MRFLKLLPLAIGLLTAPLAYAQEPLVLADRNSDLASSYELDLSVPDSPGLAMLGLDADAATSPADMRAFTADLLNGVGLDGRLKSGLLITSQPSELFERQETIKQYRTSQHALRRALWDRTRISLGTAEVDGQENAVRVGFGVTFQLLDHHDPRMVAKNSSKLDSGTYGALVARLGVLDPIDPTAVPAGYDGDTLHADVQKMLGPAYNLDDCFDLKALMGAARVREVRKAGNDTDGDVQRWDALYKQLDAACQKTWKAHVDATPNWLLSVGQTWQSTDGKYDNLDPEGVSVWTAYTHPIDLGFGDGFNSSATLFGRYSENQEITVGEDATERGNTMLLAASVNLLHEGEWQFGLQASFHRQEFDDVAVADKDFMQYSASVAYRLADQVWLKGSYGGRGVEDEEFFRLSVVFNDKGKG